MRGVRVLNLPFFTGFHASAPLSIYFSFATVKSAPPFPSSHDTSNPSSHRRPTSAHHAVDCSVRSHLTGLLHISPLPQLRHRGHPLRVPQHRQDCVDREFHHPHLLLIMNPRDDRPSSPLSAPTPVVLRIMPKVGSSAPIGYIYDPDPSRDGGEGGLLAA
jgi:hypothetical protein